MPAHQLCQLSVAQADARANKDTRITSQMNNLQTSLEQLEAAFNAYREAYDELQATSAPRFSAFAYVRTDEYGLSGILRDLLDPKGTHGQRDTFLQLFLIIAGIDGLSSTADARVTTESTTFAQSTKRRLDLDICGRDWEVGIENKPWARDQDLQIADYLNELRLRGAARTYLIYLTDRNRPPSTSSIAAGDCQAALRSGQLKLLSYEQIARWLDQCRERCRARAVSDFLEAFRDFIHHSVLIDVGGETDNIMVSTLLSPVHRAHLPIALELLQAKDSIRYALMGKLMSAIRAKLPEWTVVRELTTEHGAMGIKPPLAQGWHFCLEFQSGQKQWCYGIAVDADANPAQETALARLAKMLRPQFPGSGTPNTYWPLWFWFNGRTEHDPTAYSNWDTSTQAWLDMYDGTMAHHLTALALSMTEAVGKTSRT